MMIVNGKVPRVDFLRGPRASIPVIIAIMPVGMVFGAIAVDNGLAVGEAVLMSATIFGGASQMVAIELHGQKIAPWLIVVSIFAVNFRHLLYSADFGRRIQSWSMPEKLVGFFLLTDAQYAETERMGQEGRRISFAWYLGMGLPIWILWVLEAWSGAYFGRLALNQHALGLDFLLPIYFLGLVLSFRARPLWFPVVGASAVASVLVYELVGSPWHILIGALAGILVAAVGAVQANAQSRDLGQANRMMTCEHYRLDNPC